VLSLRHVSQAIKKGGGSTSGGQGVEAQFQVKKCDQCDCDLKQMERQWGSALCDDCWEKGFGGCGFKGYSRSVLARFCIIALMLELSANATVIGAFQPIVVERFGWGTSAIATVNFLGCGLSCVVSQVLAWLRLKEKHQIIAAAIMYFLGTLVFSLPPLSEWRVVVGLMLGIKAQVLFMAPFTATFSRLIGRWRLTNQLTMSLCMAPAIGGAVGMMLSPAFVRVAGTGVALLSAVPAGAALAGIACGWLDDEKPRGGSDAAV
jgi:hypothetical protein